MLVIRVSAAVQTPEYLPFSTMSAVIATYVDDNLMAEAKKKRKALLAQGDVFAEEEQAKQDALDALVDNLAGPSNVQALQSFLASDAAQQDKIDQLVNFLADGPAQTPHDELMADKDLFADRQTQRQKALDALVDKLANNTGATATALLATNADDVDVTNAHASFLNVVGGAVLLLVAVVLAVVTKRRSTREEEDEHKDFGYSILYE